MEKNCLFYIYLMLNYFWNIWNISSKMFKFNWIKKKMKKIIELEFLLAIKHIFYFRSYKSKSHLPLVLLKWLKALNTQSEKKKLTLWIIYLINCFWWHESLKLNQPINKNNLSDVCKWEKKKKHKNVKTVMFVYQYHAFFSIHEKMYLNQFLWQQGHFFILNAQQVTHLIKSLHV